MAAQPLCDLILGAMDAASSGNCSGSSPFVNSPAEGLPQSSSSFSRCASATARKRGHAAAAPVPLAIDVSAMIDESVRLLRSSLQQGRSTPEDKEAVEEAILAALSRALAATAYRLATDEAAAAAAAASISSASAFGRAIAVESAAAPTTDSCQHHPEDDGSCPNCEGPNTHAPDGAAASVAATSASSCPEGPLSPLAALGLLASVSEGDAGVIARRGEGALRTSVAVRAILHLLALGADPNVRMHADTINGGTSENDEPPSVVATVLGCLGGFRWCRRYAYCRRVAAAESCAASAAAGRFSGAIGGCVCCTADVDMLSLVNAFAAGGAFAAPLPNCLEEEEEADGVAEDDSYLTSVEAIVCGRHSRRVARHVLGLMLRPLSEESRENVGKGVTVEEAAEEETAIIARQFGRVVSPSIAHQLAAQRAARLDRERRQRDDAETTASDGGLVDLSPSTTDSRHSAGGGGGKSSIVLFRRAFGEARLRRDALEFAAMLVDLGMPLFCGPPPRSLSIRERYGSSLAAAEEEQRWALNFLDFSPAGHRHSGSIIWVDISVQLLRHYIRRGACVPSLRSAVVDDRQAVDGRKRSDLCVVAAERSLEGVLRSASHCAAVFNDEASPSPLTSSDADSSTSSDAVSSAVCLGGSATVVVAAPSNLTVRNNTTEHSSARNEGSGLVATVASEEISIGESKNVLTTNIAPLRVADVAYTFIADLFGPQFSTERDMRSQRLLRLARALMVSGAVDPAALYAALQCEWNARAAAQLSPAIFAAECNRPGLATAFFALCRLIRSEGGPQHPMLDAASKRFTVDNMHWPPM